MSETMSQEIRPIVLVEDILRSSRDEDSSLRVPTLCRFKHYTQDKYSCETRQSSTRVSHSNGCTRPFWEHEEEVEDKAAGRQPCLIFGQKFLISFESNIHCLPTTWTLNRACEESIAIYSP